MGENSGSGPRAVPEHAERGVGGRWSVVTGGGRGDWSPEAKARVGTSRDSRGRKGLAHAEGPGGGLDFTEKVMGEMSWNLLLSVCIIGWRETSVRVFQVRWDWLV